MDTCCSIDETLCTKIHAQIKLAFMLRYKASLRDIVSVQDLNRILGEVFVLDRRDGILNCVDVRSRDDVILLRFIDSWS